MIETKLTGKVLFKEEGWLKKRLVLYVEESQTGWDMFAGTYDLEFYDVDRKYFRKATPEDLAYLQYEVKVKYS